MDLNTELFDLVVGKVLENNMDTSDFLTELVELLELLGWDTQENSEYYDNPEVREAFKEVHPEWFEHRYDDDDDGYND